MKEQRLLFLLLLTSISLSAQVKGVVLDSISGKPIAYVGVFSNKTHLNFSSDEKGKFKEKGFDKIDTLWFFTTGYEIKKILVKDLKQKVYLNPIAKKELIETTKLVGKSKTWIDLTSKTDSLKSISPTSTRLYAYYLNGINSKNRKIIIDTIEVKALSFPTKKTVFKLRFFESDSLQNIGKELEDKSVIVFVDNSNFKIVSKTKTPTLNKNIFKETISAELSNKNTIIQNKITLPKDGIFIAFEILNLEGNIVKPYNQGYKTLFPLLFNSKTKTKTYTFEKGKWILEEKNNFLPKIKISIIQEEN